MKLELKNQLQVPVNSTILHNFGPKLSEKSQN